MTTFLLSDLSSAALEDLDTSYSTASGSMIMQSLRRSFCTLPRLCSRKSLTFDTELRCISNDLLDVAGCRNS